MRSKTESPFIRYSILLLSCIIMIGSYFVYDLPASTEDNLLERFTRSGKMSVGTFEYYFNLLYSVYSLPNILLPLFFGWLIDATGTRAMLMLLNTFLILGHAAVTLGCFIRSMPLMLFGRAVFGLGGESLNVAATVVLSEYFGRKEMAMALAFNLCTARAGSVLNDFISPVIADMFGAPAAFSLGFGLLIICGGVTILLIRLDIWVENEIARSNPGMVQAPTKHGELKLGLAGLVQHVRHLPGLFWIACLVCGTVYASILPFNNVASALLVEEYFKGKKTGGVAAAREAAGQTMSLVFASAALLSPIAGVLTDKLGFRTEQCVLSGGLLVGAFTLLLPFSRAAMIPPEAAMILLGLAYTIFATVIWPCVGTSVGEDQRGMAYGTATAVQNLGLFLTPLAVATVRAETGSFAAVVWLFLGIAVVGLFSSFGLLAYDRATGSRLGGASSYLSGEGVEEDGEEREGLVGCVAVSGEYEEGSLMKGGGSTPQGWLNSSGVPSEFAPTTEGAEGEESQSGERTPLGLSESSQIEGGGAVGGSPFGQGGSERRRAALSAGGEGKKGM